MFILVFTLSGMLRHLMSLRTMEKDHGWIHTLLEEVGGRQVCPQGSIQWNRPPGVGDRYALRVPSSGTVPQVSILTPHPLGKGPHLTSLSGYDFKRKRLLPL